MIAKYSQAIIDCNKDDPAPGDLLAVVERGIPGTSDKRAAVEPDHYR
jgi:hypothetical protein